MIEIIPIGGYSEIGRSCTLVKYKDEAVMIDLGLSLDSYVRLTENDDGSRTISRSTLIREGAIPDLTNLDELKFLKAICISHAHLDHVGAVSFYADQIKTPIHGTNFTIQVLKVLIEEKRKRLPELISHPENSTFRVSKHLSVEFIHVTHSTPQSVIVVIHTPVGCVVYANDFKLDDTPTLGEKTNIAALKKLKNVKALIMNSLYAQKKGRTLSEADANRRLEEVLFSEDYTGRNIIATTFSSHIARLRTLSSLAKMMGRKPVFIGRSMAKYLDAAKEVKLADFEKEAEFVRFGSTLEKYFKQNPFTTDKFFIVTGHQAEPKAILSRLASSKIFPFKKNDVVIFSSKIIPSEQSFLNKEKIDLLLKSKGIIIHDEVHVSGHASSEEQKELISILKPENLIPTHGDLRMMKAQEQLAIDLGYKKSQVHILENFSKIYV
ncbi:MAG: MBL fold metallo-hydrolase RNA specificity domain-containing protein [Candidatus Woesearchaeota archaeon]|jgi:ribonuclease J